VSTALPHRAPGVVISLHLGPVVAAVASHVDVITDAAAVIANRGLRQSKFARDLGAGSTLGQELLDKAAGIHMTHVR
jgi:hypothetical protein